MRVTSKPPRRILHKRDAVSSDNYKLRLKRIATYHSLLKCGFKNWELERAEARALPGILHQNEYIGAAVLGKCCNGRIMIVATNLRLIYVDIKPMFKKTEDISYESVAGLSLEWVMSSGTLIIHTRMGDFPIRTNNKRAATRLKNYTESRCIEKLKDVYYEPIAA